MAINYIDSIKRPFTDLKKLAIGILLNIIPIINFFAIGYILECARTAIKKDYKLPEWRKFSELFVKGLIVTIIWVIYFLPAFVVLIIGLFNIITANILNEFLTKGDINPIINALATTNLVVLVVILFLLAFYISPIAVLLYSESKMFNDAFTLSKIFRFAFKGEYFFNWLIAMIILGILNFFFGLVPYVGGAISGFIGFIIVFTILGQVYSNLKKLYYI